MVFGKEKKVEKCEFEFANDDPWKKPLKVYERLCRKH